MFFKASKTGLTVRLMSALLALLTLLVLFPEKALAVDTELTYSYVYDAWGTAVDIPDTYCVGAQIDTGALDIGQLNAPSGLYVSGGRVFICDTGNNRIIELAVNEKDYTYSLKRIIGAETGAALSQPTDICLSDGLLIIADGGNNRVLILDEDLNQVREIHRPDSTTVDSTVPFVPQKLSVTAGHIYIQAKSVNKGLMEFDLSGEFLGYFGASPVKFDWQDYFWKLLATDEQRAAMNSFVPTEYNNVSVDDEGFLMVSNSIFTAAELRDGSAEPVRRLNLKGTDILIENGNQRVIGDINWDYASGPSRIVDIAALDDNSYYLLDSTRGRIFGYDEQGNMLCAFGGLGTRKGYFSSPSAMDNMGRDLLVLDSQSALVTVFTFTDFGKLVSAAIGNYNDGHYAESGKLWRQVLGIAGNYEMAWDGIGKVMLREGDYEGALQYLKYASDEYYYSKAWKLYRKQWIEEHIWIAVVLIGALLAFIFIKKVTGSVKGRIDTYETRMESHKKL
ncbi:MAG: hypothetical protein IKR26_03520 [Lachnospiraceae bacterium]|nr:hypothetical protein [Lachnospiraceae bacterium]